MDPKHPKQAIFEVSMILKLLQLWRHHSTGKIQDIPKSSRRVLYVE